jgi:protein gp37
MAENSKIEWCSHTFNPWRGCTKVSPGCTNCYAETMSGRNHGTLGTWGPKGTRVFAAESYWRQPLKWDKAAAAAGERHRVFCASLADVFEEWSGPMSSSDGDNIRLCLGCGRVGTMPIILTQFSPAKTLEHCPECGGETRLWTMDEVRARLFALIDATPNLDWLLLTKRPENIARMMPPAANVGSNYKIAGPPGGLALEVRRRNVWLGVSVEDQQRADERIPLLLQTPAAVRFLSVEPLLGPVDLTTLRVECGTLKNGEPMMGAMSCLHALEYVEWAPNSPTRPRIDWVIVGGESGPGARPMHPDWARGVRDQCQAAGVPFFFKQWGEWAPEPDDCDGKPCHYTNYTWPDMEAVHRVGKKAAGRALDGRTWDEYPASTTAEVK